MNGAIDSAAAEQRGVRRVHDRVTASFVMSPRTRINGSTMLRFVNQADAAGVFVERPRCFHRTRVAV